MYTSTVQGLSGFDRIFLNFMTDFEYNEEDKKMKSLKPKTLSKQNKTELTKCVYCLTLEYQEREFSIKSI